MHRSQITFDCLDTATGEVTRGEIRPATRARLRIWLQPFTGREVAIAGRGLNRALETGPTVGLAVLVSLAGAHAAERRAAGSGAAAATVGGYGFALTVAAVAFAGAGPLGTLALRRQHDPTQIDNPVGGTPSTPDSLTRPRS